MTTYNTAIIGTGFIGVAHVEALRRLGNVNIVAICDARTAKEKAEQMNIERYYYDYCEMFDKEQLDMVHICTPNNTHFPIAMEAMSRGINVLCEKPMCLNVEEAAAMEQLAREKNLVCAVNFHNRFFPITREMKSLVESGEVGKVFSMHGGYIQDWLAKDTDYSWHIEAANSGACRAVADIGLHWIDLAQTVVGSKVVEVMAEFQIVHPIRKKATTPIETFSQQTGNVTYEPVEVTTEDHADLILKFENGATATAVISQLVAGRKNKIDLFVSGTKKSLHWCTDTVNDLFIGSRDGHNALATKGCAMGAASGALASYPAGHAEGFPDAFKQSFTAVYHALGAPEEARPFATFQDGLYLMKVLEAIHLSSQERRWITVK